VAVRRHLLVSGKVQGVWFRGACTREAITAGLSGWVANRSDGRVEAVFEGDPEAVARLVAWCHHGPSHAEVTAVEVDDEPVQGERGFHTR
jgi:acylphosphatase